MKKCVYNLMKMRGMTQKELGLKVGVKKLNEEKSKLIQEKKISEEQKSNEITKDDLSKYHIDLSNADFKTKQAIVQKLIKKIIIDDKSVTIEWHF